MVMDTATTDSTTDSATVDVTVSFRGTDHTLRVFPNSTLADLKELIAASTGVPASNQKLLGLLKPRLTTTTSSSQTTSTSVLLSDLGITGSMVDDGVGGGKVKRILLVGSTKEDVDKVGRGDKVVAVRKEWEVKERRALQTRKIAASQKSTVIVAQEDLAFTFKTIETLPNFSDSTMAKKLLGLC